MSKTCDIRHYWFLKNQSDQLLRLIFSRIILFYSIQIPLLSSLTVYRNDNRFRMKIRILLVLLTVVSTAEIVFRRREYTALTTGEKISGKVTEISTVNPMDCIRR